ncbi:MAG: CrpP-related protein [Achromobacter sp.]|uniref:CrpP-related protein n=1 Tax=unclassified Achromobacter TaxID=2626865 RepID=UPI0006FB3E21|nr:CrpP-related protein [Achromobacter sp. Root565]KQZ98388.1 hypothetical protein ASD71_21695 [Achromobacter sp. Root565]
MQREDIQKLGAQAARDGLSLWDCPYYRAAAMPGHTGESISQWRVKVEAWEAGWLEATGGGQAPPGIRTRFLPRAMSRLVI